jgi:hypothetical protein
MARPNALDPLVMFLVAEQYRRACNELAATDPLNVALPAMVSAAFALEVYFKCIFVLETNQPPPNQHNLRKLFELLAPATQVKIRALFAPHQAKIQGYVNEAATAAGVTPHAVDFDNVLNFSQDAFVLMRYIYESLPPMSGWFGHAIMVAARQHIVDLHPDWPGQGPLNLGAPIKVSVL